MKAIVTTLVIFGVSAAHAGSVLEGLAEKAATSALPERGAVQFKDISPEGWERFDNFRARLAERTRWAPTEEIVGSDMTSEGKELAYGWLGRLGNEDGAHVYNVAADSSGNVVEEHFKLPDTKVKADSYKVSHINEMIQITRIFKNKLVGNTSLRQLFTTRTLNNKAYRVTTFAQKIRDNIEVEVQLGMLSESDPLSRYVHLTHGNKSSLIGGSFTLPDSVKGFILNADLNLSGDRLTVQTTSGREITYHVAVVDIPFQPGQGSATEKLEVREEISNIPIPGGLDSFKAIATTVPGRKSGAVAEHKLSLSGSGKAN